MRYYDELAYNLAREREEIAMSQRPGKPEVQAIHREMARLYGSLARGEDTERPVPNVSIEIRI